jgi:hypothetical protein
MTRRLQLLRQFFQVAEQDLKTGLAIFCPWEVGAGCAEGKYPCPDWGYEKSSSLVCWRKALQDEEDKPVGEPDQLPLTVL